MDLKHIAICNLKRRKGKAAFILFGLLIGVSAVVAFVSLVDALGRDINQKLEKYGANILILPKTESLSLTYGGISLGGISFEMQEIPQQSLQRIESIKNAANVAAVGPMVLGIVNLQDTDVLLAGMDFDVSHVLRPWWSIRGEPPKERGLLAGSEAARILELDVGRSLLIGERELEVTGILEPTGSQDDHLLFAPLGAAQTILDKEGKISMAEVAALCAGCPIEEMVKQISQALPEAKVMGIKQVVQGRMATLHQFRTFGYGVSGLVMLVGALVVLVTMIGSVRERTSEFGIFRAIGFRKNHLVQVVLLEAAIISILAGLSGYLFGIGATKLSLPMFTDSTGLAVGVNPALAGGVLLLALVLGLASSAYPALLAARLDPNEALRTL